MPFAPSAKQRPRPRRALAGSAEPLTEASARRTFVRLEKAYAKKAAILQKGTTASKEPELRDLRVAAHALLANVSLEALRAAELEVLGAAERMARNADHQLSLAGSIAVARGVADALEAKVRSLRYGLDHEGGYNRSVFVVAAKHDADAYGDGWLELRHAVCAASPADYAAARARAATLREGLGLLERARIAYVFPDEPWAADDLRACVADPELASKAWVFCFLLGACADVEAVRAFVALPRIVPRIAEYAFDLASALPEADALALLAEALGALLVKPKHGPLLKTPPRDVASAIACFRTPEAAALLAPYAGHAVLGPQVAAFFQDAPELRGSLEPHAKGKTKHAETAARLLRTRGEAQGEVAPDADVPAVLRGRPWRPRKGMTTADVVLGLKIPADAAEHVELEGVPPEAPVRYVVRDMTPEELDGWREEAAKGHTSVDFTTKLGPNRTWIELRVPKEEALRAWNEHRAYARRGPLAFLREHGVAAIPGFVRLEWLKWLGYDGGSEFLEAAGRIRSPHMAAVFAHIASRRKKYRRAAHAWLGAHPSVAALGLVPAAVGLAGAERDDAEQALLFLAQTGEGDAVRAAARSYGAPAVQAIDALLARDPLALDRTAPKAPDFLRVADLPAVRLRSGARLGDEALDALVEMLRVAPLEPPYPGIARVLEACAPASLSELAAELVEQWVMGGAPGRHEWMLLAAAAFPGDAATRRVAGLAREWARKDAAKAARACAALAAIGSDLALLHLAHVADTSRFEALRKETRALLEEAAEARGLTAEELGDRTVPDLGLERDGTLTLSYGPRSFTVRLDEALRPTVEDAAGEVLRTLPRAAKTDDAALAKAARVRFDALKADAESVAERQLRRLERAMVVGRTFDSSTFQERIARQPMLLHLARRLLWENDGVLFRVAEDGSLADVKDQTLELPPDARVRLVHPARMAPGPRAAWAALFLDYEILQPFDQLGRAVVTLTPSEAESTRLARTAGIEAAATRVLGALEARGWRRDDTGHVSAYLRDAGKQTARLPLTPGIPMGELASAPLQKLGELESPVPFGTLDPVDVSEMLRDVESLRG